MSKLTADEVARIIDLATFEAERLGKALSIAVVDGGGFILGVVRMDGARPMTPSIAISKAYSAAVMQRPTRMLKGWSKSDPVFFSQVATMGMHPIVATLGGLTLKRDGEIVGAVGISGGSPEEDEHVGAEIVESFGFDEDFEELALVKQQQAASAGNGGGADAATAAAASATPSLITPDNPYGAAETTASRARAELDALEAEDAARHG
ncbi:GlcG/HbpS family heme-binding protein [Agromyces allii]|uniref:Heme-binding protein n=1 Tax=Agromyces allii TaxID=393607 RepID=A0ABP5BEV0_9MICO|nr:heme-binding protein [Agromyces allii]